MRGSVSCRAAADDAGTYYIEAIAPMHVLAGTGMGQEHFEAMAVEQVTVVSVATPPPRHILSGTGMGHEHFEALMAQASNP